MATKIGIEPENDLVFVSQVKVKQTVSASGIILTEVKKFGDVLTGTVVAVSENSEYPLTVKLDNTVYFIEKDIWSKTVLDGKEYLVLQEKNILGYEA
jgi:co-chaperonin GroES (HSP10)